MPVIIYTHRRTRPPLATDDMTQQYFTSAVWWDEVNDHYYRLDNHTANAAVWTDITPSNGGGGGPCGWASVTGKPSTFPAAPHTHPWDEVTGKPLFYPPDNHAHLIAGVSGLQTALDAKELLSAKGNANGYAGLDGTGKVPAAQLPATAGPFSVVKKTSADQTNATVNLAAATGMTLALLANTDYIIEGFLKMRSSLATAGFKVALDVPVGALVTGGIVHAVSAAGAVSGAGQRADAVNVGATTGVDAINADLLVYGYWLVENGANAGNAQLMFAAEVAATVTLRTKSTMRGMPC